MVSSESESEEEDEEDGEGGGDGGRRRFERLVIVGIVCYGSVEGGTQSVL